MDKAHESKRQLIFTRNHEAFTKDMVNCFRNILIETSKGQVINLLEEENLDTTKHGKVNDTVLSGAFEIKLEGKDDGIDVTFPKFDQLWMALEFLKNRKHLGAINLRPCFQRYQVSKALPIDT